MVVAVLLDDVIVLDKWDGATRHSRANLWQQGLGVTSGMRVPLSRKCRKRANEQLCDADLDRFNATALGSDLPLFADVAWLAVSSGLAACTDRC